MISRLAIVSPAHRQFAAQQLDLCLPHRFDFRDIGFGFAQLIKLLHQRLGRAICDGPQAGDDGFCALSLRQHTEAFDFFAIRAAARIVAVLQAESVNNSTPLNDVRQRLDLRQTQELAIAEQQGRIRFVARLKLKVATRHARPVDAAQAGQH